MLTTAVYIFGGCTSVTIMMVGNNSGAIAIVGNPLLHLKKIPQ